MPSHGISRREVNFYDLNPLVRRHPDGYRDRDFGSICPEVHPTPLTHFRQWIRGCPCTPDLPPPRGLKIRFAVQSVHTNFNREWGPCIGTKTLSLSLYQSSTQANVQGVTFAMEEYVGFVNNLIAHPQAQKQWPCWIVISALPGRLR